MVVVVLRRLVRVQSLGGTSLYVYRAFGRYSNILLGGVMNIHFAWLVWD
jgi:hypothetical protein